MTQSVREALAVRPGPVNLAGYHSAARPVQQTGKLRHDIDELSLLQQQLWAMGTAGDKRRVLLLLQGIDTAGKGGVTKHVVGALGPIGVQYTGFKAPTKEELRHDFLWRIRKQLPPPGVLGVFDRSHYEDVLIVRVHEMVSAATWRARYDIINDFEAELAGDGMTIIKVFLNISFDTQRERLLRRLDRPDKHWKFNVADLDERALWTEYQTAYSDMLEKCNTAHAPWYIVPSDSKGYRNWAVGEILRETLAELDLSYPDPALDIAALKERLAPPH
ncbi:PPK2 family polyphosphate kinase [uncultured Jatrophihabitans sp.]|uniref:PPK2 family polyphosphate kinase n=1 Tax=uncultured Jatrophihabitans sp. TaxID=1610747 RepID=UPI0035CBCF44